MEDFVNSLKISFSRIPFFVRIFLDGDKIVFWNDIDIKYVVAKDKIMKLNKDEIVKVVSEFITKKIEEKYAKIKHRKISVIIPNYNNEDILAKTIRSILRSDYKDIEVIVVDDCSTDGSVRVVKDNFGEDVRLKLYVNKENRGTYYSRNVGLLKSTGYYVTYVDGDDYIDAKKYLFEKGRLDNFNGGGKVKVWGFGTGYERLYFEKSIENVYKREHIKTWLPKYLFYRKLFNYVGFYQNNRFGADDELVYRARSFGYEIRENRDKVFYHAYTAGGKNLTKTIDWGKRRAWFALRKKVVNERGYIEMALLDNTGEFFEQN